MRRQARGKPPVALSDGVVAGHLASRHPLTGAARRFQGLAVAAPKKKKRAAARAGAGGAGNARARAALGDKYGEGDLGGRFPAEERSFLAGKIMDGLRDQQPRWRHCTATHPPRVSAVTSGEL